MKSTSWFIFFLLLAVSCLDEPDCFQLNNNWVGIAFKIIGSGATDTVALGGLNLGGTNSGLNDTTITGVSIPLNPFQDQTEVNFVYPGGNRKLLLGYKVQTQYVSEDCGARYVFSDLKSLIGAAESGFDSLRIVNTSPFKSSGVNVEIYRCPETNVMGIGFRQYYLTSTGAEASQAVSVRLKNVSADYAGNVLGVDTTALVFVPVDLSRTTTTYTFEFSDSTFTTAGTRTLVVNYALNKQKPYDACDSLILVSNLDVGTFNFSAANIVVDSDGDTLRTLQDPPQTNVYVYRCPQMNQVNLAFKSATGAARNTAIESIRTDYWTKVFYANTTVNSVTLPLNADADQTTFYIDYGERTDTVSLSYTRSSKVLIKACGEQDQISSLAAVEAQANVKVTKTDVTFPPTTNIEITVN